MSGSRSRWAAPLVGIFLAYQVAMPLTYYAGDDDYDERFSWRMFSTRRLARCNVNMDETRGEGPAASTRPIDLGRSLQVAWVNMLKRYRPAVVHEFMLLRCRQDPDVQRVRYVRSCVDTDGSPLPTLTLEMACADGDVREVTP